MTRTSLALDWTWPGPLGRRPSRPKAGGQSEAGSPRANAPGDGTAATSASRFGGGGREGEWVTIYNAGTVVEAHVVRGRLESESIPVQLRDRSMSSFVGGALHGGVDVRVPRAMVDRARSLLGLDREDDPAEDG